MKLINTLILLFLILSCSSKSWKETSRESAGIAPKAHELKEDIVQVYYARAFSWRGNFAVHPWIAWKKVDEEQYTVAQVTSWNIRREGSAIRIEKDLPDRLWFDNMPTLAFEARGKKAATIIEKLKPLIENYPYKDLYRIWPGPNSNTFVSYLNRNIEELDIELPPHAIGKDYLGTNKFIAPTASNTGYTLSAFGLLGVTFGRAEGIEFNLLGLNFGVDFADPALKLPFAGRVGYPDRSL
ncbi:DUF3750 domain-containing protein [Halobacteriovorax sp.]|uniref:DUF3750 domain-containing protein n=1 Tax=Halobacteriovorax sp. TaxID=2020862 RepID=UPI003AF234C3